MFLYKIDEDGEFTLTDPDDDPDTDNSVWIRNKEEADCTEEDEEKGICVAYTLDDNDDKVTHPDG